MYRLRIALDTGSKTIDLPLRGEGPKTLGRLSANDLVVKAAGVSRRHAELYQQPGNVAVKLVDLGSKNGLYHCGRRQSEVLLLPGSEVGIGKALMSLEEVHSSDNEIAAFLDWSSSTWASASDTQSTEPLAIRVGVSKELPELDPPPGMVWGESPAFTKLCRQVQKTVGLRRPIMLQGETGTGKELFAKLIHRSDPEAAGELIALNCAAIPSSLVEAELFGVARRVATDVDARRGRFETADRGTLFLDEIAELPLPAQSKLLRVLDDGEVLPLGAARPKKVDVRVVAACNCDLRRRVAEGDFRKDLFFRFSHHLDVPSLRDRRQDIAGLARAFARRVAEESGWRIRGISRRALLKLEAHSWPGNVRELKSTVEIGVLNCRNGGVLESRHLPELRQSFDVARAKRAAAASCSTGPQPRSLDEELESVEKRRILEALSATHGNRRKAARMLGRSPETLYKRLRKYGLKD